MTHTIVVRALGHTLRTVSTKRYAVVAHYGTSGVMFAIKTSSLLVAKARAREHQRWAIVDLCTGETVMESSLYADGEGIFP